MKSALNWFEIPVAKMDRAIRFYEAIFETKLREEHMGPMHLAIWKTEEPGVGGALALDPARQPHANGTLVYLNANGRLDEVIGRVARAGGKVEQPKTDIGQPGFIAVISDTEGNHVGLHSER
jgi:predicted enzyme related to lactoylglutathione lyase